MVRHPKPWQRIEWTKPPQVAALRPSALNYLGNAVTGVWRTISGRKPPSALDSLSSALAAYGSPSVPGVEPLEEAQIILSAGAEIEHSLLVEYLYAAWSLGTNPAAGIVTGIAIQEMCHLITVQNLLMFAGNHPSFSRQDQDPAPCLDPFPFSLRPFAKDVLEDFLLAEMPPLDDMDPRDKAIMLPIIASHSRPGPSVNPVGLIYAKLYWLFQKDDTPTIDWPQLAKSPLERGLHIDEFPGAASAATFQADPQEGVWHLGSDRDGVFMKIDSRDTALKAIFAIAAQGEGLVSPPPKQPAAPPAPSHFSTFMGIYRNTDFAHLSLPKWPTDPFVANQPGSSGTQITHPLAAALCRVFDRRYQILLASLRAALSHDRSSAQDDFVRNKYVTWAFQEMLGSLKSLVGAISNLPCTQGGSVAELAAAPTFNLAGLQLPDDAGALDGVLSKLHQAADADITVALAAGPNVSTALTLKGMQRIDRGRFPNLNP
jgi:Ferritin-like